VWQTNVTARQLFNDENVSFRMFLYIVTRIQRQQQAWASADDLSNPKDYQPKVIAT